MPSPTSVRGRGAASEGAGVTWRIGRRRGVREDVLVLGQFPGSSGVQPRILTQVRECFHCERRRGRVNQ